MSDYQKRFPVDYDSSDDDDDDSIYQPPPPPPPVRLASIIGKKDHGEAYQTFYSTPSSQGDSGQGQGHGHVQNGTLYNPPAQSLEYTERFVIGTSIEDSTPSTTAPSLGYSLVHHHGDDPGPKKPWETDKYRLHICHCDKTYTMSPNFDDPSVCRMFLAKVCGMKTLQLFISLIWLLTRLCGGHDQCLQFVWKVHFLFWIFLSVYVLMLMFVRLCHIGRESPLASIVFFVLTFSQGILSYLVGVALLKSNWAFILPHVLFTLFGTFGTLSLLPYWPWKTKINVQSKVITLGIGWPLALAWSLVGLLIIAGINTIGKSGMDFKSSLMGSLIYGIGPGFVISGCIVSIEMLELQRMLTGKVLSLSEHQWVFAAIYI